MKNIRLFITSSSLVLAAWLGASFMTEVSPKNKKAEASSQNEQGTASNQAAEEKTKAPLPVAHLK